MRAEIVAIGSELLLGQIVDTNSTFIADQLAQNGIDCVYQARVGDNHDRIVAALHGALSRADAVIVCGGLGPTADDITREAIAEVIGVELVPDAVARERMEAFFAARSAEMPPSNLRQALVPVGATVIEQVTGTAPGLICPVGHDHVIYALPGVPAEMEEMLVRGVVPDLRRRSGEAAVIASRALRTVGLSEALIGELVEPRLAALDAQGPGAPTIAFLANAAAGVTVRVTVKAPDQIRATARLAAEEAALRAILGDAVFGIDDTTIEAAVGAILVARGWTLSLAESFTGGLIASRVVATPGASTWFRGGVVAYDAEVKFDVLGVERGEVVSERAAIQMADGARRVLGSDVAIATTGVAGPDPQEGIAPGTVFIAVAVEGTHTLAERAVLSGSRPRVRDAGALRAMALLRSRLLTTT